MQASPRPPAKKAPKFLDAKIMIAALSAAVTVGFWNLFAGQSLAAATTQDDPNASPQPEAVEEEFVVEADQNLAGLPPIPTLVPLTNLTVNGGNGAVPGAVPGTAAVQGGQSAPLRSVAAPTVVVVQKSKPMVDSPVVTVIGSGRGGGSRPSASTRSSR